MNRIKELDLVKSFVIIISMIGIHVLYDLAELTPSVPVQILNVLATDMGAPMFMFCMGVTLGFSRRQDAASWLRRGIHLITIGMFLNMLRYGPMAFASHAAGDPELVKGLAQIFNVDILQFAGLAFMLLALCKRLRMGTWALLALALAMNVAGTLLTGHFTQSYVANQLLGYFYHTPVCSCFPLLNWFLFVAAGNAMGRLYRQSPCFDRRLRWILPLCGVVAVAHQYLSITGQAPMFKTLQNDWEFYSMATPDALCVAFGVAPFMLGLFRLAARAIPERWVRVLAYPARHINQYYCISWVWIMWIANFLYFIEPAATFGAFSLRWLGIVVLTTVTVLVYSRCLQARVEPFFVRHRWGCYIAVWVAAIGFGAWYFTHVPGPYLMPY